MHHNVIRFETVPPRELTLLAPGTMWPTGVLIDGEYWKRTERCDEQDGRSIRIYAHDRPRRSG